MIEDLINQNVRFEGTSKGWQHCKCKSCNDYKIRASFNFEDAKIRYSCFNCGISPSYTKNSTFVSKEFREVLNAYGITDHDIDLEVGKNFFTKDQLVLAKKKAAAQIAEIPLPDKSYPVTQVDENDMWTIVANEYLAERGLSLSDHKWFLSASNQFRDRLVIPYYKDNKIIYWQARSFDERSKKRYIDASTPKEPVMFNLEELERYTDSPLFIMEGVFDAISIGGIGLLGSKLYAQRIELFKKSRRRKIFVIDKKDKQNNGYKLGLDALKHGWEITYVTGDGNDVNASVSKYGKLWTIKDLLENTCTGLQAQIALEIICKNHSA